MVSTYSGPMLSRELPKLTSKESSSSSVDAVSLNGRLSYPPVRNKLAEQNGRPMNQTYTIGTRELLPSTQKGRERSCSIDSDIAEYTIQGAIAGLFPRAFTKSNSCLNSAHSQGRSASKCIARVYSTKLPSLDGCSPERKCTQRPFGRAQLDLQKYKESIRNAS